EPRNDTTFATWLSDPSCGSARNDEIRSFAIPTSDAKVSDRIAILPGFRLSSLAFGEQACRGFVQKPEQIAVGRLNYLGGKFQRVARPFQDVPHRLGLFLAACQEQRALGAVCDRRRKGNPIARGRIDFYRHYQSFGFLDRCLVAGKQRQRMAIVAETQ